jgi:tetratricopeptide (TPR) repeat protein
MADVFISYSSEDRNRVRPLAEALQSRGFNVWWDRALGAGQDYTAVIEAELAAAKAVIVVWTQGSAASTFVRDEAGRARDEGRLVPVLLDRVNIPLGFGSFQAEDFTRWNGGADAPQMQILEEALKAKIEGRSIDGGAVARKRRRLMQRIRLVSVLTVIFLVVGIAVGVNTLFKPDPPAVQQADLRAELLRLLAEGKLTPEQAIQLAQILEAGALGDAATQEARAGAPAPGAASESSPSTMARSEDGAPMIAEASLTTVSEAEFNSDARDAYRSAMSALLTHPDAQVRQAAAGLGNPRTRDASIQTLWAKAQAGDPMAAQIYQVCGAVGTANDNPIGPQALEASANLAPSNRSAWRMLSYSYRQRSQERHADAAALVGEAAQSRQQGQTEVAEQQLQEALPNLPTAGGQAVVASELGAIAETRQDWGAASARFAEAYRLREQAVAAAPQTAPAQESLQRDAQRLVVALDRSGRTRQACERLQQAQEEHAVESPDAGLEQRCSAQFRVQLRPELTRQRSVTPQVAPAPMQQTAPAQRVAPQSTP